MVQVTIRKWTSVILSIFQGITFSFIADVTHGKTFKERDDIILSTVWQVHGGNRPEVIAPYSL